MSLQDFGIEKQGCDRKKVELGFAFSKWSIEKLKIFIMLRSNFFTFLWYKAAALTPILGKEMNEARINGWVVFVCSTSKERPFPTIKITQLLARDRQFLPNLYDYPKSSVLSQAPMEIEINFMHIHPFEQGSLEHYTTSFLFSHHQRRDSNLKTKSSKKCLSTLVQIQFRKSCNIFYV